MAAFKSSYAPLLDAIRRLNTNTVGSPEWMKASEDFDAETARLDNRAHECKTNDWEEKRHEHR